MTPERAVYFIWFVWAFSWMAAAFWANRTVAVAGNQLYRLDQAILLDALGPWTDDNSATLESAIEYLNEETSYAGVYQIYPNGPRFIPGTPRPPQNPPRHDEDTVR